MQFAESVCAVCGKRFTPRTTSQVTCGGECTRIYMHLHYHKGMTPEEEERRRERREHQEQLEDYKVSLLEFANMGIQRKGRIEGVYLFHQELAERYPDQSAAFIHSRIARTARQLDMTVPAWRTSYNLPRQAALIEVLLAYGYKLLDDRAFVAALKAVDTVAMKSLILRSSWAGKNGRYAVGLMRRLQNGIW